ncbi:CACTA en-spm transposon protein [Cucumis melo var. makuwa]|uniref:CACTA en-spm transposon protein n=1 Tax=Cucumis melo var. makuwa TaxID=1194695 RepID=A0A5D3CST6_CUCMM|nr:CACTA en-spm transposon protein [Cucumis melo var. makuwa]
MARHGHFGSPASLPLPLPRPLPEKHDKERVSIKYSVRDPLLVPLGEKEPKQTGDSRAGGSAWLEKQESARLEDWDRLGDGADRRGAEGSGSATTQTRLDFGAGSLSIGCSSPLKSSGTTVTGTSKSTVTSMRLVPTHPTYWWDVMRIDTFSMLLHESCIPEQSWTNKATKEKQPYNHSNGSKSVLQRQHELVEQRGESIDRVELFWETYVRSRTFVWQAAEDTHVLGRRPDCSKGLGWGPKPKAHKTTSASSSLTSCLQFTEREIQLQVKLDEALEWIEHIE